MTKLDEGRKLIEEYFAERFPGTAVDIDLHIHRERINFGDDDMANIISNGSSAELADSIAAEHGLQALHRMLDLNTAVSDVTFTEPLTPAKVELTVFWDFTKSPYRVRREMEHAEPS